MSVTVLGGWSTLEPTVLMWSLHTRKRGPRTCLHVSPGIRFVQLRQLIPDLLIYSLVAYSREWRCGSTQGICLYDGRPGQRVGWIIGRRGVLSVSYSSPWHPSLVPVYTPPVFYFVLARFIPLVHLSSGLVCLPLPVGEPYVVVWKLCAVLGPPRPPGILGMPW